MIPLPLLFNSTRDIGSAPVTKGRILIVAAIALCLAAGSMAFMAYMTGRPKDKIDWALFCIIGAMEACCGVNLGIIIVSNWY